MSDARFLTNIGARIKKIRIEQNMPQHKLAALCDFEKASMSRLESGKANPTILTLRKVSTALNVPITALFIDQ